MRTALVAIGRRENQYASEWVRHHLAVGFSHIYIYDNNHDGEEHFESVLSGFIGDGKVTVINFRNREKAQRPAYNDAYQRFSAGYDWIAFFDFDEFLCFGNQPSSIIHQPSAINHQLSTIPSRYDVVMIPWLMMTDNGLIRNDHRPLMERFTESTARGGGQGKCIVRGGIDGLRFTNSVHVPYEPVLCCCTPKGEPTAQKRHQPQDTSVVYLKHFSTKTIEEWLSNKMQKGAAGITYATFCEKYRDYFFTINERTPEKEAFISNYLKTHK
jgi:hypothetical protein